MKRLSEEFEPGQPGSLVLHAGYATLDPEREKELRDRVLGAAAAGVGVAVAGSTAAAIGKGSVIAKLSALKLVIALTLSGTVATVVWMQQDAKPEVTTPAIAHNDVVQDDLAQNDTTQNDPSEKVESAPKAVVVVAATPSEEERMPPEKERQRVKNRTSAKPVDHAQAPILVAKDMSSNMEKEAGYVRRIRSDLDTGSPKAALSQVKRYVERFPKGALAQDVGFLRLRALHAIDTEQFEEAQTRYLRKYPQSPYRSKIDALSQ